MLILDIAVLWQITSVCFEFKSKSLANDFKSNQAHADPSQFKSFSIDKSNIYAVICEFQSNQTILFVTSLRIESAEKRLIKIGFKH